MKLFKTERRVFPHLEAVQTKLKTTTKEKILKIARIITEKGAMKNLEKV